MSIPRRVRSILLACVASNAAFAVVGLVTVNAPVTDVTHVAGGAHHRPKPTTTTNPLTTDTTAADRSVTGVTPSPQAPHASPSTSSHASSSTRTSTTRPAAAVDDMTGIVSSAAPPPVVRVAPGAGSYAATFAGSASVNGRAQAVPSTGSVVFTATGSDLRQSSPNTPGDVKITQRFSQNEARLVSFQLKAGDTTKVFTPSSPALFIPYSSPSGSSWTWSATSSDGATHVSVTGGVGDSKTMTIAGQSVSVTEITASLSISGDISGSADLTMWVSNTLRLPVVQRQVINAKASSGYGFSSKLTSDVTQTLTSLTPQ